MTHLLSSNERQARAILLTDRICMSTQQTHNQTENNLALRASVEAHVALRYQKNDHITLTQNNSSEKLSLGTISIYETTVSRPQNSMLKIHDVWNSIDRGEDRRGRLLFTQNFDDGRCYQINDNFLFKKRQQKYSHASDSLQEQNLWCKIIVILSLDLVPDNLYTLYWIWDWSTVAGTSSLSFEQIQLYTTCLDVMIV